MKEVVVHAYCDVHNRESHEKTEARTVTISIDGDEYEIELCLSHIIEVTELLGLLRTFGRPTGKPSKQRRERTKIEIPSDGECPICHRQITSSRSNFLTHVRKVHHTSFTDYLARQRRQKETSAARDEARS